MLAFLQNKIVLTQLVAGALAVLALLHVVVPTNVTAATVVAAIMLVAAAVSAVLRFGHDGGAADAKAWYLSRTVVTAIVVAIFAVLALLGIVPSLDQESVIGTIMAAGALLQAVFGGTASRPIG